MRAPAKVEWKYVQKEIAWQGREDPWGLLASKSGLTCEFQVLWETPSPYFKMMSSSSVVMRRHQFLKVSQDIQMVHRHTKV